MASATPILACGDSVLAPDTAERVGTALRAGEVVALPTETVYGLAVRADDAVALERLAQLKQRDPRQPLTWHVGSADALAHFEFPRAMLRRLVQRYWPGPLTLVLRGVPPGLERVASAGWTGVRQPAHAATAGLLAALEFPVVASSANLAGRPPLVSAAEVAAAFGAGLACVVDGGRARLGEGSVVLRLGAGHFDVLRAGIIDVESLRATAGRRVAFVCTGNTCRSPMAEGLARDLVARRLEVAPERLDEFGFHFASMGVMAGPDAPAAAHAVQALAARDVDLSGHRSQPVVPEELADYDVVYTLTHRHLEALQALLPPGRAAHCTTLSPDGRDVPDPIGGSAEDYARTADA
ncbi:MAG TPA: L-threonylcarbamoyladenylate synthase, partial [Planctomycetota bacterium]|nr:L-threonylcarbamoyladenylate synthase [Planctomycetota bacterium]